MPPWPPAADCADYLGERRLTAAELAHESARDLGAELSIVTEQRPQALRQRADPMADGRSRQDGFYEMHGRVGHAAPQARRTKATTFAAQGYQTTVSRCAAVVLFQQLLLNVRPPKTRS